MFLLKYTKNISAIFLCFFPSATSKIYVNIHLLRGCNNITLNKNLFYNTHKELIEHNYRNKQP